MEKRCRNEYWFLRPHGGRDTAHVPDVGLASFVGLACMRAFGQTLSRVNEVGCTPHV
nr:hypothetical protein [Mycobacterium kyorinense]